MKSFEEQYPGYPIIPLKKPSRVRNALTVVATVALLVGVPAYLLYRLGGAPVPLPATTGVDRSSLVTLRMLAMSQAESGDHESAVRNFGSYFRLGGAEAEVMAAYALSLNALGDKAAARLWSGRALKKDPQSAAARMLQDQLN